MTKRSQAPKKIDPEIVAFEAALLRSIDQARTGVAARTHTANDIEKRRRGRPVGSTKPTPKIATGIRFDADVLAALKASGRGWQSRVNAIVRKSVLGSS